MVGEKAFVDALLVLVGVAFLIGVGVVFLYLHYQKNLISQKLQHETLKNAYQGDLLRASIQVQEDERKSIAQDVHDELGAVLAIMRMNLRVLEQQPPTQADVLGAALQNVRGLAETALASVRTISHRLLPPQLEAFGLVKTLESVAAQINAAGALALQLRVAEPLPLPWAVSLGLYRIIMELLSNTVKHSGADSATVAVFRQDGWVMCQYRDNGIGMRSGEPGKGLGHRNIEGRVSSLNGQVDFYTGADGGFSLELKIPVETIL